MKAYLHLDFLEQTLIVDWVILDVWVLGELAREFDNVTGEQGV